VHDFGEGAAAVSWICRAHDGATHFIEMRIALAGDGLAQFPAPTSLHAAQARRKSCPASGPIAVDAMP
jgi:hypothetical protein